MKTSIALTTYNGEKYIKPLLESLRNQSMPPDEIIIIDDCSSDNTYELVKDYIDDNNLIGWQLFRNESNIGWKKNFREALKKCNGDIIFLCDQDDVWQPYKIVEMYKAMMTNPTIQLLVSNYSIINVDREEKIKVKGLSNNDGSVIKLDFKGSALTVLRPGCTYCVRKPLVEKMIKNDLISAPHDAMLWGYAAITDSLYLLNRKTIEFRRHSDSASTPEKNLCRTRRISELKYDISIEDFFKNACKNDNHFDKATLLNNQIAFNKKRIEILENKSLFSLTLFAFNNKNNYPTFRNLLSDFYVLLLKRD